MIKHFNLKPNQKNIDIAIKELKNDKNNAIAHIYSDAKISNNGKLAGVPITIKNLFATKDAVTDASCNLLSGFLPGYDAHIITLLKNEGASIVAKTNLDELALGGTGLYSAYGIIKNPLDSTRIVGGSSSGSAATFTKNIGASIGSDTGDSIRMPAAYVGAVGYKPSYGAISRRGMFPYASSLDTVGYLTHNVYDSAVISSVLFDLDKRDATSRKVKFEIKNITIQKPKKISYIVIGESEKYIQNSMTNLITKLQKNNVQVTKINIEKKILDSIPIVYKIISFSEAASNNSNLSGLLFGDTIEGDDWSETMVKTRKKGFGDISTLRMILGSLFLKKENQIIFLEKAHKIRGVITKIFTTILDETDVLIFPTTTSIAPKIADSVFNTGRVISNKNYSSPLLLFSNFIGSPSISIPLGRHQKMPYGLNINSKIYNDEKLLSFSMYFEKLLGETNE